jgi:DinB superfamily
MQKLQYPIGHYQLRDSATTAELISWIQDLEIFPDQIKKAIAHLTPIELQKTYRPQGWTIAQVVHHCADSHSNCLIRLKLAITENNPTIKPYHEAAWANLCDYDLPISIALNIIEAMHYKIVALFKSLKNNDWHRTYYHPENKQTYNLIGLLSLYAWHCKHHLAHVMLVVNNENKF